MRGRGGRDQAARGSTPTHRHLLTRVIITDYWANTNQVLLQMKCIILLLLEKKAAAKPPLFSRPCGQLFGLCPTFLLYSLRHSFIHQGLPFGHHCPSLWSPMSIPLVTKVTMGFPFVNVFFHFCGKQTYAVPESAST